MRNKIKQLIAISGFGPRKKIKFKSDKYFYCNGLRLGFQQALKFANGNTALDIGAGFGNEVKVLLTRDYAVTAIEANPEAVKYLNKLAKKRLNNLTVLHQSLPNLSIAKKFDFVVCEMVLHFLDKKDVMSSVKDIQSYTTSGGINAISSYVDEKNINNAPKMMAYYNYLFKPGELKELYKDWEILHYEEAENIHSFVTARIVARKPK